MAKGLLALCRALSWIQLLLLLTMLAVMASLVFTRYVLSYSPPWSEELTRFAMIWMVLLGGAVLSLFDDHITLTVFTDLMPRWMMIVRNILVRLILIATSAIVAWKGLKFADGMSRVVAWGLNIQMTVPAYSVAVAFAMITVFCLILLIEDISEIFGKRLNLRPRQSQVMDGSFRPSDDL